MKGRLRAAIAKWGSALRAGDEVGAAFAADDVRRARAALSAPPSPSTDPLVLRARETMEALRMARVYGSPRTVEKATLDLRHVEAELRAARGDVTALAQIRKALDSPKQIG